MKVYNKLQTFQISVTGTSTIHSDNQPTTDSKIY
jgi:hypothetical protein